MQVSPTGASWLIPGLWFQGTEDHDTPRQRWHFDLWLAPQVAAERITAAVATGGSIVEGSAAPAFRWFVPPHNATVSDVDGAGD